jgi:acetyl esterase/lipase
MRFTTLAALPLVAFAFAIPASAQRVSPNNPDARPPALRAPSNARPPRAAADMQAVLDAHARLGARPIHLGTPSQVRAGPTPADAVKAVMAARGLSTVPDPTIATTELAYGRNAWQKARIYRPAGQTNRTLPLIVYYHGGGWVIADLDVYDSAPRMLSKQLNALVVSVEYRHAPEFKFPAQHEDAVNAYRWVLSNARAWGGDVNRMAFAGESAGGNLAINTAMAARDARLPMPRHILSIYPIADSRMNLASRFTNANAKPLSTPDLAWFSYYYSRRPSDGQDTRINLVAANLRGLPPVTIVSAQIDPLLSDGLNLTNALRRAGVPVMQRTYPGVTHEFFGMGSVVRGAAQANAWAVQRLRPALSMGRR